MKKNFELSDIFFYILQDPIKFPGLHNNETIRTNTAYDKLEPLRQYQTIFKALSGLIYDKISEGQGVYLRNFGAFCFEIKTESKNINLKGDEKKHIHEIRPCFIPAPELISTLVKYLYSYSKEEISASKSQHSLYQTGYSMVNCNASILAHACFLEKKVAESAMNNFVKAVIELIQLGKNLDMDFGICKITIFEKNIKYTFDEEFVKSVNQAKFEKKLKKSSLPTSSCWRKDSIQTQFIKKSNVFLSKNEYNGWYPNEFKSEKTELLDKAALDLTSVEKTKILTFF